MSQRVRGSDGKHKGFNEKNKFRSLWVTDSGMDWVSAMEQGALELCIEGPYSELYPPGLNPGLPLTGDLGQGSVCSSV